MTPEEKELLLQDLCARLPYGVIVQDELGRINKLVIGNADLVRLYYNDFSIYGENAISLPFLHPMSSMTIEEHRDWMKYCKADYDCEFQPEPTFDFESCILSINWLNKNHFDYRGLIEKGLAIAVTEENNPYEN